MKNQKSVGECDGAFPDAFSLYFLTRFPAYGILETRQLGLL